MAFEANRQSEAAPIYFGRNNRPVVVYLRVLLHRVRTKQSPRGWTTCRYDRIESITAEAQRELMVKDECRKAIHRRGAEKGLLRLVLSNFDVLSAPLR